MQSVNGLVDLQNLIPQIWSTQMYTRLRQNMTFMNIFSRAYEGQILGVGDVVKINQIGAIAAETLTDDKATFSTQDIEVTQFQLTANRRAVASVEITDMALMRSLEFQNSVMDELQYSIMQQIESYIISLMIPSASAPDHDIAPVSASDLAPVDLSNLRTLASRANWPLSERYFIPSPEYYSDLTNKTQVMSFDFTRTNDSGNGSVNLYSGFRIAESNQLPADVGYAVHPSAIQAAMQSQVQVKISDLHSQKKFGKLISADIVFGAALFDNKRIIKISG